jgi:predicted SAM-dependent methyltransferase
MRGFVKALLPEPARRQIRQVRKTVRYALNRQRIKGAVRRGEPLKIIVGAAETWRSGWDSTNEQWHDISSPTDWQQVFGGRRILAKVVAEHVFEHLTRDEAATALRLIAAHLVPGGRVRIAVPDGYHPDPTYLRHVDINGIGDDAADHKQLLNVDSLMTLLEGAGFRAVLVDGYRRDGSLTRSSWRDEDGYIWRSHQNASTNTFNFVDAETSLIVDGILI